MSSIVSSSASLRGRCVPASQARGAVLLSMFVTHMLSGAACTSAPEPPPAPRGVLELSERYEHLTADLDRATAQQIVDRPPPQYAALQALSGLTFLRDVLSDVSISAAEGGELPIDVQGSLTMHAACPGWEPDLTPDEAKTGFVELTLGVDDSRLQRAFTGTASRCKFGSEGGGESGAVSVSMELEVDLGRSFVPGEPLPPLLVQATDVRATNDALGLGSSKEFSVRVNPDKAVETLVDLAALDLGRSGTFLLARREDGRSELRGRDDEWLCGRIGSEPCMPAQ